MTEQPWDALANAHARLLDAERAAAEFGGDAIDRALAAADLEQARAEYAHAREQMECFAAAVLHAAVGGKWRDADDPTAGRVRKDTWRLFAAQVPGLLDALKWWGEAQEMLDSIHAKLDQRDQEISLLLDRLNEMQRQIDDMTPGVGHPGLRLVAR